MFIGREPVLTQLQEVLAAHGRAALSGLGGVGKTQTAVEYAHRHLDEYAYAFWATARSREALLSSYVTIASLLKLPESNAKEQTLAVGPFSAGSAHTQAGCLSSTTPMTLDGTRIHPSRKERSCAIDHPGAGRWRDGSAR